MLPKSDRRMHGKCDSSHGGVQMGRRWSAVIFEDGCFGCIVAASIAAYWFFVSLIPVYNKYFFQKEFYPYPIATAGVQLGVVGVLLVIFDTARHFISRCKNYTKDGLTSLDGAPAATKSWVFGPHMIWKIKWVAPIGFLFGLKYGITNLGLDLVPAPTHLLLQSTDLVWTLLGAWWINGERVSPVGLLCLMGCVAGSAVLSFQLGEVMAAPIAAIVVNLVSPILLGLCITTLRAACVELMRPDNCVGGTVGPVELTALKLVISSAVAFVLACIFEGSDAADDDESLEGMGWWGAFQNLSASAKLGVLGGSIPILAFQVNCTFLTFLTSSIAVGIVGQLKIVPQWIVAALFAPNVNFKLGTLNIVGGFLIMTSAGTFAIDNWLIYANSTQKSCEESATSCEDSEEPLHGETISLLEDYASPDHVDESPCRSNYFSIDMDCC